MKGAAIMKRLFLCIMIIVFIFGCASVPMEIPELKSQEYDVLGEGTGTAVGIMLFNFIPIKQNTRFQRAYQAAVDSRQGDQLLSPVVVTEKWFWAYILNGYTTTVRGTVIKYRK